MFYRYEDTNMAKARQQAEGNKKIEDVIVIYRTSKASNGGELGRESVSLCSAG